MSKTIEDRFNQLREMLHDETCSPSKRQASLKVLLKFPETKDEATAALTQFADEGQVWAIEYEVKELKRREDSSVVAEGIAVD